MNLLLVVAAVIFLLTALNVSISVLTTVPFGLFVVCLALLFPVGTPLVVTKRS